MRGAAEGMGQSAPNASLPIGMPASDRPKTIPTLSLVRALVPEIPQNKHATPSKRRRVCGWEPIPIEIE